MANIVSDQTEISFAESITNWSGDTFVLETESKVQGSSSVSTTQTNNGSNIVTYTPATALSMLNSHIRLALNSSIIVPNGDTEAANGVEVVLTHTNGTARFTITGSDTYKGGWQDYFFNVHATPTSGVAYTTGTVSVVTLQINTSTKPRNSVNGWYDNWRFGNGLTINSTTTEAISFQDVANTDVLLANAWGILQDTKGVLFGRGKLTLGSTGTLNCNLVSVGETIYFEDANVATDLYAIVLQEGTGATDISISGMTCKTVGNTGAELDFSATVTSCTVTGSSFTGMGACTFHTGASITSDTFTDCTSLVLNGCDFESNNVNTSGLITVTSGGTFTGNNIKNSTGAISVTTADLALVSGNSFVSDGSNHAVELTSIGAGSMVWGNTATGYVAGATGSPVTPTATGNEALYVNVATGTLTVNVADGAAIPSIRSAGATVNVVAGQKTMTFTVSPSITGYEYAIYTVTAKGSLAGRAEVQHVEVHNSDTFAYTYTYSAGVFLAVQLLFGDGSVNDYAESVTYYDLAASNQSITINLNTDINN